MAHTAAPPSTSSDLAHHVTPAARTPVQHPPVTPGKVAMWLFLATEVMFFTGLIGSYIVLRAGSPPWVYTNLYPPGTDLHGLENTQGILIEKVGSNPDQIVALIRKSTGLDEEHAKEIAQPHGIVNRLSPKEAQELHEQLEAAGAHAEVEKLHRYNWPKPYDKLTNPLSIDLTAGNTFVLICSSVTMVLALSAFQRNQRRRGTFFLFMTTIIGACFVGVQAFEYRQLWLGHHYPPGISAIGHFRPSVSLFASCFFIMTGFHGAHVTGGVIAMGCLTLRSFFTGAYGPHTYNAVENIGLYWHFVDLVWIILFTLVYLL